MPLFHDTSRSKFFHPLLPFPDQTFFRLTPSLRAKAFHPVHRPKRLATTRYGVRRPPRPARFPLRKSFCRLHLLFSRLTSYKDSSNILLHPPSSQPVACQAANKYSLFLPVFNSCGHRTKDRTCRLFSSCVCPFPSFAIKRAPCSFIFLFTRRSHFRKRPSPSLLECQPGRFLL